MTPGAGQRRSRPRACSTRPAAAARTASSTCCPGWSPRATSPGSGWPRSIVDRRRAGRRGPRSGVVLRPGRRAGSAARPTPGVEDPRITWVPRLGAARDDLRRLRPARPAPGARRLRGPAGLAAARPGAFDYQPRPGHRPEPVPQQGRGVLPRAGAGPGRHAVPTPCCTGRCGTSDGSAPGEGVHLPAGVTDDRPGHLDLLRARSRGRAGPCARWRTWQGTPAGRDAGVRRSRSSRSAPVRRRSGCDEGWLLIHHGVTGEIERAWDRSSRRCTTPPARMILDADDPCAGPGPHRPSRARRRDRGRDGRASCPTWCSRPRSRRSTAQLFVFYGMADSEDRRRPAGPG